MPAKDREGREIIVLFLQGKGRSRKLVAPKSVGEYLEHGHVNTIKHADRVLQGMTGWELPHPDDARAKALKAAETHDKLKRGQRNKPR